MTDPENPQGPVSEVERIKQDPDYQEIVDHISRVAAFSGRVFQTINQDEAAFLEVYAREAPRLRADREARQARERERRLAALRDPEVVKRELNHHERPGSRRKSLDPSPDAIDAARRKSLLARVAKSPDEKTSIARAAEYFRYMEQTRPKEDEDDGNY